MASPRFAIRRGVALRAPRLEAAVRSLRDASIVLPRSRAAAPGNGRSRRARSGRRCSCGNTDTATGCCVTREWLSYPGGTASAQPARPLRRLRLTGRDREFLLQNVDTPVPLGPCPAVSEHGGAAAQRDLAAAEDLNGDGKIDCSALTLRDGRSLDVIGDSLRHGQALSSHVGFPPRVASSFVDARIAATGDYDGDGHNDLLWRSGTRWEAFDPVSNAPDLSALNRARRAGRSIQSSSLERVAESPATNRARERITRALDPVPACERAFGCVLTFGSQWECRRRRVPVCAGARLA